MIDQYGYAQIRAFQDHVSGILFSHYPSIVATTQETDRINFFLFKPSQRDCDLQGT
jgi:hypothetical protein